jgi:hypothetical protein
MRLILAASTESAEARTALINLLSAFPASGKAGKKWLADAGSVLNRVRDPASLAGILGRAQGREALRVTIGNERPGLTGC